MWKQPIYDRTEADVLNRTPKAYCNVADLQRLEDNCSYLAGLLGVTVNTRAWAITDFPTVSELARIRGNIAVLRAAYYTPGTTPPTPDNPLNHWERWNAAERILYDLEELYRLNLAILMRAGEGYAGDTIGVI